MSTSEATTGTKPDTTPKRTRAAVCPITQAALRMVVERGHLGITNSMVRQATKRSSTQVGTVLAKLKNRGLLAVGRVTGCYHHWFANEELAQRWMTTTTPPPKPSPTPRQNISVVARRPATKTRPATASRGSYVVLNAPPDTTDAHVVVPPGVRVQRWVAPTHDTRYQCAPGERPAGAGFAAAGIGRDVTTGQAWGAQA